MATICEPKKRPQKTVATISTKKLRYNQGFHMYIAREHTKTVMLMMNQPYLPWLLAKTHHRDMLVVIFAIVQTYGLS